MTTTLHSTVQARLGWTWRDRAGSAWIVDSNRLESRIDLADGTGRRQADAVWHAYDQVLGEGQSVNIELDGLEQNLFGGAVVIRMARVKALLIVNKNSSGPGYLHIGGAQVDEWYAPFGGPGGTLKVMPDGLVLLTNCSDGWIVDAQHAVLRLAAAGGSVTFDIAVLGTLNNPTSSEGEPQEPDSSSSGI